MNKEEIQILLESVKRIEDIHRIEGLYFRLLSEPGLQFQLTQDEIIEVRWLRAINLLTIANSFLVEDESSESELTESLSFIDKAINEVEKYRAHSTSVQKADDAGFFLMELEDTKEMIVLDLEALHEDNLERGIGLS